jgi:hypothetical protein
VCPRRLSRASRRLLNFTVDGTVGAHGAFGASAVRFLERTGSCARLDYGDRKLGC